MAQLPVCTEIGCMTSRESLHIQSRKACRGDGPIAGTHCSTSHKPPPRQNIRYTGHRYRSNLSPAPESTREGSQAGGTRASFAGETPAGRLGIRRHRRISDQHVKVQSRPFCGLAVERGNDIQMPNKVRSTPLWERGRGVEVEVYGRAWIYIPPQPYALKR